MDQQALIAIGQRKKGDAEADAELQHTRLPSRIVKPEAEHRSSVGCIWSVGVSGKRRPCGIIQNGVGVQKQDPWCAGRFGPDDELRAASRGRRQDVSPLAGGKDFGVVSRSPINDDDLIHRRKGLQGFNQTSAAIKNRDYDIEVVQ